MIYKKKAMNLNNIKNILLLLLLSGFIFSNSIYKVTSQQKKVLNHAKSLRKSGLIEESKNLYSDLFYEFPYLKEALHPLSLILKNDKEFNELDKIATLYQKSYDFSLISKIETFEIFIWTNNSIWIDTIEELKNNKTISDKNIEKIMNFLLKNNKIDNLLELVKYYRETKKNDYFSFQLGLHYSFNMSFEKSIAEYLTYLKANPSKKALVKNRIMAYPDIDTINEKIKTILREDNSNISKMLLSDIEFKEKNYTESYNLIKQYSNNENEKIALVKNLNRVKQFEIAEIVINDIFETSTDKIILKNAVLELAKIYENYFISKDHELPISNHIMKNELLNSNFIKINNTNSQFLTKAISIYDSLRTYSRDDEATYNLAEIKYRILGDLDGAEKIYKKLAKNYKSKYYNKSIIKIIDISISKGDLNNALDIINNYSLTGYDNYNDETEYLLKIKKIHVLFYSKKYDELKIYADEILKDDNKNNKYYNDVLKIVSDILLLKNNIEELNKYSEAMFKLYQNKRMESIKILSSINEKQEKSDKINFELAYLYFLQNNFDKTLSILENINVKSPYIESSLLLQAEIYDYILNNKSKAVELYLLFLDTFPNSIHYDLIRLRLRGLAS